MQLPRECKLCRCKVKLHPDSLTENLFGDLHVEDFTVQVKCRYSSILVLCDMMVLTALQLFVKLQMFSFIAVSYTHLTLPTIYSV